jgi:hypothetical protein
MNARRKLLFIATLALAGCSSAAEKTLLETRAARSITAEAATAMALAGEDRASSVYAEALRQQARRELRDVARKAATDSPPLRELAGRALSQIEMRDAAGLKATAGEMARLEEAYGRAG